jgi:hypothetical protein
MPVAINRQNGIMMWMVMITPSVVSSSPWREEEAANEENKDEQEDEREPERHKKYGGSDK